MLPLVCRVWSRTEYLTRQNSMVYGPCVFFVLIPRIPIQVCAEHLDCTNQAFGTTVKPCRSADEMVVVTAKVEGLFGDVVASVYPFFTTLDTVIPSTHLTYKSLVYG